MLPDLISDLDQAKRKITEFVDQVLSHF